MKIEKFDLFNESSEVPKGVTLNDIREIALDAALEFCDDSIFVDRGFEVWWKSQLEDLKKKRNIS